MRTLRHLLPLVTPNVARAAVAALLVALTSVHATAQSGPADLLEGRIEAAASAFKEECPSSEFLGQLSH